MIEITTTKVVILIGALVVGFVYIWILHDKIEELQKDIRRIRKNGNDDLAYLTSRVNSLDARTPHNNDIQDQIERINYIESELEALLNYRKYPGFNTPKPKKHKKGKGKKK